MKTSVCIKKEKEKDAVYSHFLFKNSNVAVFKVFWKRIKFLFYYFCFKLIFLDRLGVIYY